MWPRSLSAVSPGPHRHRTRASLLAVQVFTPAASGPTTDIAEVLAAVDWILQQQDRLRIAAINLSVTGARAVAAPCRDEAVERAVAQLRAAGITLVAAAGNGSSADGIAFPACVAGVVSVGSVGATGRVSSFSNRAHGLTLFAPGERVVAAAPGVATQTLSGTSQATPHVAGALALLRERHPAGPAEELVDLLDRTAAPVMDAAGSAAAGALRIDRAIDQRYAGRIADPSAARPFTDRYVTPTGAIERWRSEPGRITAEGFVVDPASVLPRTLTATVNGVADRARVLSAVERGDLAARFPGYGTEHGYVLDLDVVGGLSAVCVFAQGARSNEQVPLGCASFDLPRGEAFGALDVARGQPGAIELHGWAIDPDTVVATAVHVYVDGVLQEVLVAGRERLDVGAAFALYGPAHGFSGSVATAPGRHTVCVYAIGVGEGGNPLLRCAPVTVPGGDPFGALDVISDYEGMLRIAGWAIDPDTRQPIEVHVYVDGGLAGGVAADRERRDVGASFTGYGSLHGFDITLAAPLHRATTLPPLVCVYGINAGAGVNALIGCHRSR